MDETVLTVIVSGFIQAAGLILNSSLTRYRIEQLEKKVDKHNSLVERMVKVEESAKSAHHRLDEHFEELEALKNERPD